MSFNLTKIIQNKINKILDSAVDKVEIYKTHVLASFDMNEELDFILFNENYEENNRKTNCYHPSSIGQCKRKLFYERTGTEEKSIIPPKLKIIFEIGHEIHKLIQKRLLRIPNSVAEVYVHIDELNVYGALDYGNLQLKIVGDIKSMNPDEFKLLNEPKKEHIKQVLCYMYALDFPHGQIMYVNKSNGDRKNFKFTFDYALWEEVKNEINEVEQHVINNTIPDKEPNYFKCSSCKFNWTCNPF